MTIREMQEARHRVGPLSAFGGILRLRSESGQAADLFNCNRSPGVSWSGKTPGPANVTLKLIPEPGLVLRGETPVPAGGRGTWTHTS